MSPRILRSLILLLVLSATMFAQEKEKLPPLTMDALRDPAVMAAFRVPSVQWLSDNTALLTEAEGMFRYDPATGSKTPFMDTEKAKAGFAAVAGGENAPPLPRSPYELTEDGEKGLYVVNGDIYVLDVDSYEFVRVTATEAAEENAHLSPDGDKVAYVREKNIYMYDLDDKQERAITTDGGGTILNGTLSWVYWEEIFGRSDIAYWWSPDSKSIAFLRTDESDVSIEYYVHVAPWTPKVTEQRYPKIGEKNPVVTVGIADIDDGTTIWAGIDKEKYEYIIRVDWLPDSDRLCVRTENRLQTKLDFYFVDRESGAATYVMTDENETWLNMSDDLYFLEDGDHLIIASERDGYEHLYRFTMDGKLANQITKGDWSVRTSGGGPFWIRQAVSGIDEKNGWVYFTGLKESSLERHLYRIKMDGTGLTKLSKEPGTHAITMSPDGKWYFDRYSSSTTAPSLTLYKSSGTVHKVLAASNMEGFKKYDVIYPEITWIETRDGFKVPGWIVKPKKIEEGKKYPVVVQVYGGPSAPTIANSFGFDLVQANDLLQQGYITFKVDNRAATGISKTLENLIHMRTPGEVELNDLVDAVQWLKKQPGIDPDRFGITGWSGGGTNTILAMTRSKEFKAGIAGGAVTDFRYYDTKWGEALMRTEKENKEGFEKVNLNQFAKDLHGKLMLIHGSHDDNVHIQNIWVFINELIEANKLFELMVYPERGHGVRDRGGRTHMQNLQLDFWKRNL